MKHLFPAFVVGFVLTLTSYGVGLQFGWIDNVNWLEAFSVFTSYICTYMCVKQTRLNYIFGAVSVLALSILFFNSALYASMLLNIYLFPTLIWGWFRWQHDDNTRPVKFVELKWWPVYLAIAGLTWGVLVYFSAYFGSPLPFTDSFILAASILAQFLLDQKKIENWIVWVLVNVVAIYTYASTGLIIVAIQYVFFLANTVYGFVEWYKSMNKTED